MESTRRAVINIYDADGVKCESVGGAFDFDDARHTMMEALKNDGIPVIRMDCGCEQQHEARREKEQDRILQVSIIMDNMTFQARGNLYDVGSIMADFLTMIED